MSTSKNDGGPAFPVPAPEPINLGTQQLPQPAAWGGMSLRDWFAGQALAGIMGNPERWKQIADDYETGKKTYEQCSSSNATKAYSIADAMLAQRDFDIGGGK